MSFVLSIEFSFLTTYSSNAPFILLLELTDTLCMILLQSEEVSGGVYNFTAAHVVEGNEAMNIGKGWTAGQLGSDN